MNEFAQELIDLIVEDIALPEAPDSLGYTFGTKHSCHLKSTALVSRAFRVPSQRRLFRSATLRAPTAFMSGLVKAPHIASYVRDLCVHIGDGTDTVYGDYAAAFTALTNVHRFLLHASGSWYLDSPDNFRRSLCSFFSLPQLRCVAFIGYPVPQSLIIHALSSCTAVALRSMNFDEKQTCEDADAESAASPPTKPLDRLALLYSPSHSSVTHRAMLSAEAKQFLSNLRCLTIKAPWIDSLGDFTQIVLKCSALQHLVIDLGISRWYPDAPAFTLPTIPSLRFLTFKAVMTEMKMPPSLMSGLITLPTQVPNLQVLTFHFTGDWEGRRSVRAHPAADAALANHPSLVAAIFIVSGDFISGSLTRRVRQQLPTSYADGLLDFFRTDYDLKESEFTEYFGDPASEHLEDFFPYRGGDESPFDDYRSESDEEYYY
ncbi:hypothetical protein B0H12DRAFT_1222121 [Mycena haematopus]|nr:hypothetical protein B0H12DRAFT_1222121 [Mycena haematopus]